VNGSTGLAAGAVLGGAVLLAFLALGGGALAQETDSMSLQLTPSRDSGVSGTATLTDVEGGVRVELDMRGLPEAGIEHINHFHAGGTCTADRAGNVAPATIPLKNIVAKEDGTGSGTTTLKDVTLDQLFDPAKERYIAPSLRGRTRRGGNGRRAAHGPGRGVHHRQRHPHGRRGDRRLLVRRPRRSARTAMSVQQTGRAHLAGPIETPGE
jgi:hypothetical protein